MLRLRPRSAASAVLAAVLLSASSGLADEHGSQVASSEWLPITIGGAIGVMGGALLGNAAEDRQPALLGPIVGGVIGGVAGGAGGAWVIRSYRDQDTQVAGAVAGGALGLGIGATLFARTDASGDHQARWFYGKIPAILILPTMGAFVGHRLAVYLGKKKPGDAAFVPASVTPMATPVVARDGAPVGMSFGLSGTFF